MVGAYSIMRNYVLVISIIAIFAGLIVPKGWVQDHTLWFGVALILGGIPHGASDYLIFRRLWEIQHAKWFFSVVYLLTIAVYGLIWYLSPLLAFGIFLLTSIYHFGQSNWSYVYFPNVVWQTVAYLLWGGLIVGFPVLLYHQEASLIILEITGHYFDMWSIRSPAIFLLFGVNLLFLLRALEKEIIDKNAFNKEMTTIFILIFLFATTPLLVGFGLYFVFWHSLGATLDQVLIMKRYDPGHTFKKHLFELTFLSLIAFVGLGLLYWLMGDQMNRGINLGILFLFISIITVPHTILMDRFYKAEGTDEAQNNTTNYISTKII